MTKLKLPKFFIPVKGGLGNQMFFYAFSLYLETQGIKAYLVWNEYIFTKQHNGVELFEAFDIPVDAFTKRKISFFIKLNRSFLPFIFKRILGRLFKSKYLFVPKYKQSSPYNFDAISASIITKNIYLDGFWQNYQYLNSIRPIVLESYRFKLPKKFNQNYYFEKITNSNSVSIHIRRGDYLDSKFAELNVIRSTNYYLNAIKFIEEHYEKPIFYIFTDDLIWAKQNFISDDYVFVEDDLNQSAYLDIYLMTQCKHNIIANSTFSWWGAWLNKNPSKIVIAPYMWTLQVPSSQLCPPEWRFLNV